MAANLNSILIEGTLMRDPLPRHTGDGTSVCNFSIQSVSVSKSGGGLIKDINTFEIDVPGKLGESICGIGRKGRICRAVGRLRQERRTGPDGRPRSRTVIAAEHIEFIKEQRIICDRCGRDIEQDLYYGEGPVRAGSCTGCGDSLCKDCAVSWDEDGRCKSCQENDRKEE